MKTLSSQVRHSFAEQGRLGGLKRSERLSASERVQIAQKAARARWQKVSRIQDDLASVRFDDPQLENPAFLEELLLEGDLLQWQKIYQKIANEPFGMVAEALEKVLSATKIYGVTPLWRGILQRVQESYS